MHANLPLQPSNWTNFIPASGCHSRLIASQNRQPRFLRWFLWSFFAVALTAIATVGGIWWWLHPAITRTSGIPYAERKGQKLFMDVLKPAHPNGIGIIVLISGGWQSHRNSMQDVIAAPLLRRGYTIFAVTHGSQPEFTVMEIFADLQYAVRFVRHHAVEQGVNPNRIGVMGGSSGGHLSLLLATRADTGNPAASDPVERESSALQSVAVFFPVTDLLNLGRSTENPGDGGPPRSFVRAFGPNSTNLAAWKVIGRDLSPIYHVTTNLPPVLIIHGDADTLVPFEQSERFAAKALEMNQTVKLIVRPGEKHGWLTMVYDLGVFADWFDRWLIEDK